MTMHNAQTTPIHLADPHKDILPHAYVILSHSQHCKCCGSLHKWSELYAETHLRSRLGTGYVTNLRPLYDGPQYNLPIKRIEREPKTIAFCHECHDPQLVHLPAPPQPEVQMNTGKPPAPEKPPSGGARKPSPASLDSILDSLK